MKKTVILSGGTGLEIEVARKSANFFKKYYTGEYDYFELPSQMDDFLAVKNNYELAIPVFHGAYGEDGRIFAFLDAIGLKHSFSKYDTHSICMDKFKSGILVEGLGIRTPGQWILKRYEEVGDQFSEYPLVVKPNKGGSSFHTYKVNNLSELKEKVDIIYREIDDDIIIQQFISGEEYSVGVTDGEVLPIMKLEKKEKSAMFDYESKYESSKEIEETWPEIEETFKNTIIETTKQLYDFFNIKGYCRIDYLEQDGKLYFLEVNTIPGMTEASIVPKSWKLTGRTFEQLVETITKKSD